MTEFLLELYVPRTGAATIGAGAERARHAAEELRCAGVPVYFRRTLYLPEEETCFYLYEAETIEQVQEAVRRAALSFERIVEAVSEPRSQ